VKPISVRSAHCCTGMVCLDFRDIIECSSQKENGNWWSLRCMEKDTFK
jgi:hypothetical protein